MNQSSPPVCILGSWGPDTISGASPEGSPHGQLVTSCPESLFLRNSQVACVSDSFPLSSSSSPGHHLFSSFCEVTPTQGGHSSLFLMKRSFQQSTIFKFNRTRHCLISPHLIMGDSHSITHLLLALPTAILLDPLSPSRPSAPVSQLFCLVLDLSKLIYPTFQLGEDLNFALLVQKLFF